VSDHRVLSVFELSQAILQSDTARILTIIENLKDNHVEPSLILWSITKELRFLIKINLEYQRNPKITDESLLKKYNIWQTNLTKYKNLLKKNSLQKLQKLIAFCYKIDLNIKGAENGDVFELLTIVCVKLVNDNVSLVMSEGGVNV
jgi:DNA polymerase-3 subunit delta